MILFTSLRGRELISEAVYDAGAASSNRGGRRMIYMRSVGVYKKVIQACRNLAARLAGVFPCMS